MLFNIVLRIEKLKKLFQADLGDYDMTFSLKTLSEYGRQVTISPLVSETVLESYTVLL